MAEALDGGRAAVDTGGTFTDFVVADPAGWRAFKIPSTPADPARAVLQGLSELTNLTDLVHGSTVATNAVLEGKTARTALVTTRGFRDLLFLGRQARPSLYDLDQTRSPRLAPDRLCFEVAERLAADGQVLRELDTAGLNRILSHLRSRKAEAVAVCFLFSFLRNRHEKAAGKILAASGLPVSLSSDVLPQQREYERAVATLLNASLTPVMKGYLQRLRQGLGKTSLRIMQSSGGSIQPGHAARFPIHTVLSGPAGGLVGGTWAARALGLSRVITFDMGGTSTDVAAFEGKPDLTTEARLLDRPLSIPVLDIHTVGAGGGSIARQDPGGALRVGPISAGAEPGPACYGRGQLPTVTDAHLVLGWIDPDRMAGGRVRASRDAALEAVSRLASRLNLSPLKLAEGIVQVAEASMTGAIWRITCERGRDPRQFGLISFGGAGPLHACSLAEQLRIPQVIIPPVPGAFSAFGMLQSDTVIHSRKAVLRRGGCREGDLIRAAADLGKRNRREIGSIGSALLLEEPELQIRYRGQSYELTIPGLDLRQCAASFHLAHQQLYGHSDPNREIEVVSVGLRSSLPSRAAGSHPVPAGSGKASDARIGDRRIWWNGWKQAAYLERDRLPAGCRIKGPAILVEETSTCLIPPGRTGQVDPSGCIVIT